jgi:hypothetical protein
MFPMQFFFFFFGNGVRRGRRGMWGPMWLNDVNRERCAFCVIADEPREGGLAC